MADMIISKSKTKEAVKECNVSGEFYEALDAKVRSMIKAAEKRLWETETTKAYTALAGDPAFLDAMVALVLGHAVTRDQVSAIATPGGTGAVRQGFDLIRMVNAGARVFVSDTT